MRVARTALLAVIFGSAFLAGGADAFLGAASSPAFSPRSPSYQAFSTAEPSKWAHVVPSVRSVVCRGEERTELRLAAGDDDDEDDEDGYEYSSSDDPLGDGVDSVMWLPSTLEARPPSSGESAAADSVSNGFEILPLFPLGGIVYTPNSEHVLNIFEPRYRQMYNDILMNGTKRFVVSMSHPTKEGSFAKVGVLFQLEDLKEVSEQTGDKIKYICNHKVTGRVKLNRILNPEAWESRETYLKVEGTVIDDSGEAAALAEGAEKNDEEVTADVYATVSEALGKLGVSTSDVERTLQSAFEKMVDLQHELQEDVRFTRASVATLGVSNGAGEGSLWNTIRLWQSYAEQRLVARQNDMQKEFQEKLLEFLMKEKGVKEEDVPSAIGFQDLSPELQAEVQELQRRMAVELQPLVLESTLTMQKILEAEDHEARVLLLKHFMDAERRRLEAKKTIQGMFTGSPGAVMAEPPAPEPKGVGGAPSAAQRGVIEKAMDSTGDDDSDDEATKEDEEGPSEPSKPGSIFTDEPDAFQ